MEAKKKKSAIKTVITVAIVVISVNVGTKLFNSKKELTFSNENSIAERAAIMNKDCPFTFDVNLRLDSVSSPKKNILRQNYTLLNNNTSDIDIVTFQDILKPRFKKNLKSQNQVAYFKTHNAELVYRFYDKDKDFITEIVLKPNEY